MLQVCAASTLVQIDDRSSTWTLVNAANTDINFIDLSILYTGTIKR